MPSPAVPTGSGAHAERVLEILPESNNKVYDVRKVVSFMVLCDSFNVPLIFMADQSGFLIGKEGERLAVTGKVMNWLNAMCLATVPKIALVLRKRYGLAVSNMGAWRHGRAPTCPS